MNGLRTVVALVAAGLAVSACSSGTPALSPSSTPGGSQSPSPLAGSLVPAVSVTSGSVTRVSVGPFTQEFETPLPADVAQAQVVTSFRNAQVLWVQSLIAGQALPQLKQYVVGTALKDFLTAARHDDGAGIEPSGRDVLFDIRVTGMSKTEAAIATCDYDADYTSTYRSTSKLVPGSTPPQPYLSEKWHLIREPKYWAIEYFSVAPRPSPAATQCEVSAR
jgi:hypothetical protein